MVPATWEEALEAVVRRLRQATKSAGGEALGGLISARSTNEELYLFQKLFRGVLESNNLDYGLHGDYVRPEVGVDAASGSIAGLESVQVILLAGVDPLQQQPVLDLRLKKAVRRKGARLIGIGSTETDLAKLSSLWLQVPEGAEVAVVNGILQVILSEGLLGEAARERLGGLYEKVVRSVAEYRPERVQQIAGISAETIREVAQLLAATWKVALLFPRPLPGAPAGLQEACGRLALATGSLRDGGLYPLGTESNSQGVIDMGILPRLLPGQRPLEAGALDQLEGVWGVRPPAQVGMSGLQMVEAAAEGRLSALYVVGLDPAGQEGGDRVKEALSRLELLVVQDLFMTPTAQLAHVVLPGASFAEKDGTFTNLERRVQRLKAAVSGPGEAKPDWEVLVDIARGLGADWGYTRTGEIFDEIIAAAPLYGGLQSERLGTQGKRWSYPGGVEAEVSRNGHERRLWYRPLKAGEIGA